MTKQTNHLKTAALKHAAATLQRGDLAIERSTERLEAAAVAYARSLGMVPEPTGCPIRGHFCEEHGFVHGKEAEELRAGLEKVLVVLDGADDFEAKMVVVKLARKQLRKVLDGVDARDSLAWTEHRAKKGFGKRRTA